jgi:hypothetical protein
MKKCSRQQAWFGLTLPGKVGEYAQAVGLIREAQLMEQFRQWRCEVGVYDCEVLLGGLSNERVEKLIDTIFDPHTQRTSNWNTCEAGA